MKTLLLFACLGTSSLCQAQSSITLYGQKLEAKDILGAGKVWGPASASSKTVLIKTPIVTTELNQLLGAYYSTNNFAETTDLLNILTGEREPILDSINFKFYRNSAFLTTLDRSVELRADPQYRVFKTAFLNAKNDAQRRVILFDDSNTKYREALEQSRYTVYQNPIDIQAYTIISKAFRAGLGADVAASIAQIPGASLGAGFKTAINNIINRNVTMTGAKYHEIKLRPAYVAIAKQILTYYANNPSQIKGKSEFNDNLKKFLASPNAAVTAGAAVIETVFTTENTRNLKAEIGAAVKANLVNPTSVDANKIAADAEIKFERESLKLIGIKTGQSFYDIRLVYSPDLELGAGAVTTR